MHILDYHISIFDFIEHQMQTKDSHFSKQVTDARQIFFGMPQEAPEGLRVVSVGCERCLRISRGQENFPTAYHGDGESGFHHV